MADEVELEERGLTSDGEFDDVEDTFSPPVEPLLLNGRRSNSARSLPAFTSWSWAYPRLKVVDDIWNTCARCILLDMTFSYVWSRFLSFVLLLMVTVLLGEESFYSSFSSLPSSSSCRLAHQVGVCTADGKHHSENAPTEIIVNPSESVSLRLESPSVWALRIVVVMAFANSRYLEKLWPQLYLALSIAAFVLCLIHVLLSVGDLRKCGGASGINWDAFLQRWTPAASVSGNWTGLQTETKIVADYCLVDHLHKPVAGRDMKWLRPTIMSSSVKDMWTAWMGSAVFSLSFKNRTAVHYYCHALLGIDELHACLMWLNSTDLGNSIQCGSNALTSPSVERFFILRKEMETLNALNGFGDPAELVRIRELSEELELESLAERGCQASISGSSFGLRHPRLGSGTVKVYAITTEAITTHLLSLASRGLHCAERLSPAEAQGPKQALDDADGRACIYNTDFLQTRADGPELMLRNGSAAYLQPAFFHCVVKAVRSCSERAKTSLLTTFRSACQVIFSILMLSGYIWMMWLRWTSLRTASSTWKRRHQTIVRLATKARRIFTSRVVVGLAAAAILQLGCTITLHSLMSTWVEHGNGKKLALYLQLKPEGLIDFLVMSSIWLQFVVATGAIGCNFVMHVGLRAQIMALPREVFFGAGVVPLSYRGPDLADLKRMGSTSVVYAMYFPGIVFWHLFYASWLLVLMVAALVGFFAIVFQPHDHRSTYAPKIWHWLVTASFFGSILLAHFITRLFTQRCLLRFHKRGMRVRCMCLYSWYEIMVFLLSFALGPTAALWDFLKGFFCTVLASLIIQKPNFTQFGELADYVYCTYCAALFLERVAEDKIMEEASAMKLGMDAYESFEHDHGVLWLDAEPILQDHSYGSKCRCLWRTSTFGCLFFGLPLFTAVVIGATSGALGYECPNLIPFLSPAMTFCKTRTS